MADQFTEVDSLRETLRESLETADKRQEDISRQDVLTRIENVIQTIVIKVSKGEAPLLRVTKRSSWANVRFQKSVGLVLKADASVTALQCDCPSSATKFALILKLLSVIYKLVQSDSYATKRDIYYNDPQLFGTQRTLDSIVDDVSCLLKLATSKGFISGDLCYLEEDGTKVDCNSSSTAVPVSSNVNGIRNIVSSAKFVLIVEKDATFQRLLDDDFCTRLSPCIIITGKGMPDVNSRLMVRKLWDALHIPVFALVDADPHGIEIMCVYKYGSLSMAFEAHSLTVPSVLWLGLLPSDIQRYRVPKETIIPFSQADEKKINSLRNRTYITCHPAWEREVEMMQKLKQKAEIQSLASIAPHFLTRVYLPNKLHYGGWI
ncbi:meiotic recombination protein SPO11 isoform X2 [Ctenopharyngodon idella]|uniref:meiotic recombination protein SPO11 isoform X2 n=1 Tax=Ctenopharyngodon idella TaxID=7959 RepID=UPI0022324A09|nr:meiotic recombination protein SPO11 isoform X2 [Ctenopharyngodon idella]